MILADVLLVEDGYVFNLGSGASPPLWSPFPPPNRHLIKYNQFSGFKPGTALTAFQRHPTP